MEFRQFYPSEPLRPYIRHYYLFESTSASDFEDIVYPSGDMEIIFNLADGSWHCLADNQLRLNPDIELWGQITKPLRIKSTGKHIMLGVKFFTHSAAYFIDYDINRLNDGVFDLSHILGNSIKTLHRQLLETSDIEVRLNLLERYLFRKLANNQRKLYAIDKVGQMLSSIQSHFSENRLRDVASKHNVTPRYLHKLVNQYTGLSPKSFNKISRFKLSLKLMSSNEQALTSVAYSCGYFDQSHFIRDFKSFTGVTPSTYLQNLTPVNQLLLQ
jgi:AraC-like DNA-binding protein